MKGGSYKLIDVVEKGDVNAVKQLLAAPGCFKSLLKRAKDCVDVNQAILQYQVREPFWM